MKARPPAPTTPPDEPSRNAGPANDNASLQRTVAPPSGPLPPNLRTRDLGPGSLLPLHGDRDIEAEIRDLILALTLDTPTPTADTSERCDEVPIHWLAEQRLAEQIRDELAMARNASDERAMLHALNGVLLLARVAEPAQREQSHREAAILLGRSPGSELAVNCAINLTIAITDSPACTERGLLLVNTAQTLHFLHESTRHFPFDAKHQIAMAVLHAAEQLNSIDIAKQALDHLLAGLSAEEPEVATDRIEAITATLHRIPEGYRALAAMKLYQHAPAQMPWSLRSLEAIANQSDCLPETPVVQEFRKNLNQDIYQLRIAVAANPQTRAADKD